MTPRSRTRTSAVNCRVRIGNTAGSDCHRQSSIVAAEDAMSLDNLGMVILDIDGFLIGTCRNIMYKLSGIEDFGEHPFGAQIGTCRNIMYYFPSLGFWYLQEYHVLLLQRYKIKFNWIKLFLSNKPLPHPKGISPRWTCLFAPPVTDCNRRGANH